MKEQKSLAKDIFFTTLVLVVIAIVAGAILGVVHHFTIIDEAEVMAKKLGKICPNEAGFSEDLKGQGIDASDKRGAVLAAYRAIGTDKIVVHVRGNGGFKGPVEILVLIDNYQIKKIEKFKSSETVSDPFKDNKHLSKYYGKDFKDMPFVVQKKGEHTGNIDAASGATFTSTAINNAVNLACEAYTRNYDKWVGGAN